AQLGLAWCGVGAAVLAAQVVVTLDASDPPHRATGIGADYLNAAWPGLAALHQLALAVAIDHRSPRKPPNHLDQGRGARQRGQQQQADEQNGDATHGYFLETRPSGPERPIIH